MTTLADMTLRVAREVTDVLVGAATSGTTTSLTDVTNLTQPNQHWNLGTVFIKSGANDGKARAIMGYANSQVSFASLGVNPISAGNRYAIMRGAYPFNQIVSAIAQALDGTHVTGDDYTLTGDGTTLDFVLPTGVFNVKRVQFKRDNYEWLGSNHWREVNGTLRFEYGYAPVSADVIHIVYRKPHPVLFADTDEISMEINMEWLKYKAAEQLLWWGIGVYGNAQEHHIEERMNKVLSALKGKYARLDAPDLMVNTAPSSTSLYNGY